MRKKYYCKKRKYKKKKRGRGYLGGDKWFKWFAQKQKGGGAWGNFIGDNFKKKYQSGCGE